MLKDTTMLRLTIGEEQYTYVSPTSELTVQEILQALTGLLVCATYTEEGVLRAMREFAESHTIDEQP